MKTPMATPLPTAAWPLDGTPATAYGGAQLALPVACAATWTDGPLGSVNGSSTRALRVTPSCYASAAHSPSLAVGTGSFSACVRFKTSSPGSSLLAKLDVKTSGGAGFVVEVAEGGHGLGISLADALGTSVHEELGRLALADGRWHHACVVLQRWGAAQLAVYLDGRESERLHLEGSRLAHLASVDSEAPLLLGRRAPLASADDTRAGIVPSADAGTDGTDALREVAIWSRALLPEHVAAIAKHGLPPPRPRRHHLPPRHAMHRRSGGRTTTAVSAGGDGDRETWLRSTIPWTASTSGWASTSALLVGFVIALGGCLRTARYRRRVREYEALSQQR